MTTIKKIFRKFAEYSEFVFQIEGNIPRCRQKWIDRLYESMSELLKELMQDYSKSEHCYDIENIVVREVCSTLDTYLHMLKYDVTPTNTTYITRRLTNAIDYIKSFLVAELEDMDLVKKYESTELEDEDEEDLI